ncbi:glycosyltransferase family 2 protein [Nocardioides fonticola]|uniref:Glycosyltransferase family 2 protein n=1 Tax=Nocardioides fonticola TaxID=450363 RepID=A0ABP7XLW9_9ACTN
MSAPTWSSRPTDVDVAICAYTEDRWDDLERGLGALTRQTLPPRRIILVIDHNPALQVRVADAFPQAEVVANPRSAGASGARNAAVELASAEIVAFLDDDAEPAETWLEQLLGAYDSDVVAVGGAAVPRWPDRRPRHLAPELDWIVGCSYRGQPAERTDVRNLWGCNMSVRRTAFLAVGGFDETAGRVGTVPMGAEETELCVRLTRHATGSRIVYEPSAVVRHRVTEARTTWRYLRSRSLAEGLSKAAMARRTGAAEATSVERDYVRRILTGALRRDLLRGLRGDVAGWSSALGVVTSLGLAVWGYVRGRLRLGTGGVGREAERLRGAA